MRINEIKVCKLPQNLKLTEITPDLCKIDSHSEHLLGKEMPVLLPVYSHLDKSDKKIKNNYILLHIKDTFFHKDFFMKDNFMRNLNSSHFHLKVEKAYPD